MASQNQHSSDPESRRASIVDFWIGEDGYLLEEPLVTPYTMECCAPEQPVPRTSYVHGPPSCGILYVTLPELLERRSEEHPEREAHVFWVQKDDKQLRRITVSFSQLSERSALLAAGFLDMGLRPGDRIAVAGENCPDWLYVIFAAMRIGVCPVLLTANQSSIKRLAIQFRCRAVIMNPGTDWLISTTECDVMHVEVMDKKSPCNDATSIQSLIAKSDSTEDVIRIQDCLDPESVAISYFISEYNNSCPELVSQSHFALVNNTLAASNGLWDSDSRLYDDRPFVNIRSGLLSAVSLGLTIINVNSSTIKRARDDSFLFSIMERERVTACVASWAIIDKANQSGEAKPVFPARLNRILLYWVAEGGDILEFCRKTFEQTILFYCNPECGIAARRVISKGTSITPEREYMETVPYTEMKVTDDVGRIRPPGCEGLLCIRSPYANSARQMTSEMREYECQGSTGLWIRTGYLAVIHKDGRIQVIGQKNTSTCTTD